MSETTTLPPPISLPTANHKNGTDVRITRGEKPIPSLEWLRWKLRFVLGTSKKAKKADEMWKQLPWKEFQRHVFRLQRTIFKAQKNGNKAKVKRDALTVTTQSGSQSASCTSDNPTQ
ncbi:MAG: reverse transcriptase N-terminal domain-containing protein [Prochloron sp. SP5CPC1]|nr:reverse transcriptase N-terminal domain-containing protein [Candidatus Paraprochloron terpiosi SP5CPC1]